LASADLVGVTATETVGRPLGVRTVLQDNEGCRYAQVVDGKRL